MQRLFSMFPTGRPGLAILLLRIALGLMLIHGVLAWSPVPANPWVLVILWAVAISLWLGLFTPLASAMCVLIEVTAWQSYGGALDAIHICAILIAVALALLGPGGYSLDARLYGRRQVILSAGDRDDEK